MPNPRLLDPPRTAPQIPWLFFGLMGLFGAGYFWVLRSDFAPVIDPIAWPAYAGLTGALALLMGLSALLAVWRFRARYQLALYAVLPALVWVLVTGPELMAAANQFSATERRIGCVQVRSMAHQIGRRALPRYRLELAASFGSRPAGPLRISNRLAQALEQRGGPLPDTLEITVSEGGLGYDFVSAIEPGCPGGDPRASDPKKPDSP